MITVGNINLSNVRYFLLMLIALMLPISKQLVPFLIILLVLSWLVSPNLGSRIKKALSNNYMWLFISFYLMHLLGMLYTENLEFGRYDLEIKLSFLVFPFVFASFPAISSKSYYNIGLAFIIGCAIACLADLGMGLVNYTESGNIKDMLYGRLSFFHHPSYFAMYLVLGTSIMLHGLLLVPEDVPVSNKRLYFILVPFFICMTILLMAKSGILSMGILLLITLAYLLIRKRFAPVVVLSLALIVAIMGSMWVAPGVFSRIQTSWEVIMQRSDPIDPTSVESTAERVLVWEQAIELVKEHPLLGVGTGDIKDALVEKYVLSGLVGVVSEKLNAHNQFLQSFAALGLFGFLSLALGLLLPAVMAVKKGNSVFFIFIVIISINALTESILEVQAGVVFYAFFNSFFMFLNPSSNRVNIP
jgi:O-antigen ligase